MNLDIIRQVTYSSLLFAAIGGAAFLTRRFLLALLRRWSARTVTRLDNILIGVLRGPSIYWAIAIGLYAAIGTSSLPARAVQISFLLLHALVILSFTLAAANLAAELLRYAARRADLPLAATGLSYGILKGIIVVLGVLILLGTLGVSITPLLTALGVGGLAVALALQDTLSNLFAGIHIVVEQSIQVGQFIRLESGEEGYVADIGWRTTRIRLLPNNLVIIPNSKLAQARIINFDLPEKRMAILIPVSVGYGEDLEQVEKILVEEATRGAGEIPGLLAEPAPFVRFIPGFGPSSLDLTLICHVAQFVDQYLVQHELRHRILKRFRAEGVEIPYPVRTVHLKNAKENSPA